LAWDPAKVALTAAAKVRSLTGDTERLDDPLGGYLWRSVWRHRLEELAALEKWRRSRLAR